MQPPNAVRFIDNSNARLREEVEWIVAPPRHFFSVSARCHVAGPCERKLHVDFGVIPSIGYAMDEQKLRGLFTEIGCIMEDASLTALVWEHHDTRSLIDRAAELRDAHCKIGGLLDTIEGNVR